MSLFIVLGILLLLILLYYTPIRKKNAPPLIGYIPFIGCGSQFYKDPVTFLQQCKQKYGDVFTLYMGGRYMTFLTDPNELQIFFIPKMNKSKPMTSFNDAVAEFTGRVFGIPKPSLDEQHKVLVNTIRRKLTPLTMNSYTDLMVSELENEFKTHWGDEGEKNMFYSITEAIFWSSVKCLFGEEMEKQHRKSSNMLRILDENFEVVASGLIPKQFITAFTKAHTYLSEMFRTILSKYTPFQVQNSGTNAFMGLINELGLGKDENKNWGIAFLWASQANSQPASYWLFWYILSDERIRKKVYDEIDSVIGNEQITFEKVEKLTFLKNCITETLRLKSPGMMIRKVLQDLKYKNYTIPAGHSICVSPSVIHNDPQVYDEPHKFIPERWENRTLKRFEFLPFGKGPNECPGKAFALMELLVFAVVMLRTYDISLPSKFPNYDPIRMIGLPHPDKAGKEVVMKYKKRK